MRNRIHHGDGLEWLDSLPAGDVGAVVSDLPSGKTKAIFDKAVDPAEPLELMRWLVRLYTNPEDLVVDPFAGSGTTGLAALTEGRRFLGAELDGDYAVEARFRLGLLGRMGGAA